MNEEPGRAIKFYHKGLKEGERKGWEAAIAFLDQNENSVWTRALKQKAHQLGIVTKDTNES